MRCARSGAPPPALPLPSSCPELWPGKGTLAPGMPRPFACTEPQLHCTPRPLACPGCCAQLRQAAGLNSMPDFASLLEGAPRQLLDMLRITAVVSPPRCAAVLDTKGRRRDTAGTARGAAPARRVSGAAVGARLRGARACMQVRHTASQLGATVADRLLANAEHALRGLGRPGAGAGAGGGGSALASGWRRWRLAARVFWLRAMSWVVS